MLEAKSDAELIGAAHSLAVRAHAGQVDKCGEDYMGHVGRVARYTLMLRGDQKAVQAAWLHDVVEDTPYTLDDLLAAGFSEEVVATVDALSRREGESNKAYVLRIAENPRAVIVKRADYLDNMAPDRMARLDRETALRLLRVMADSQYILGKALVKQGDAWVDGRVQTSAELAGR